jgi:hypothetical protein
MSHTWTQRLPGGEGIVGGGMGGGESVDISVNVTGYWDPGNLPEAQGDLQNLQTVQQNVAASTQDSAAAGEANAESLREQIAPVRSVSWDFMLMGRSLNIVNNNLLGHNRALREVLGYLYLVAAGLRMVVVAADLVRVATELGTASHIANTAAIEAETTATVQLAAAQVSEATVGGGAVLGGGIMQAVGGAMGPAALGGLMMFQHGGVVPQTGLAMVHKGETVLPAGGPSYSHMIINNYNNIGSHTDADYLMERMAIQMSVDQRRRIG